MTDDPLNYFTTIEEHFQYARGTGSFRLSPNDWSLIELWKGSGIPLDAVLRGIDRTFDNWRRQPARARLAKVNCLGYCSGAIESEARAMSAMASRPTEVKSPFSLVDVRDFVTRNARALKEKDHDDLAAALESVDLEALYPHLEQLELQLTAIEQRMILKLRAAATGDALLKARLALDRFLEPYREKMTAEQLAMLEKQFLERHLLESANLPRLSLFYL